MKSRNPGTGPGLRPVSCAQLLQVCGGWFNKPAAGRAVNGQHVCRRAMQRLIGSRARRVLSA
jgi:hypothetical protein